MNSSTTRRNFMAITGSLGLGLGLSVAPQARAAGLERIQSSVTGLLSTSERMISYRFQDHMWQTADGATHVLMNTGTAPGNTSLALMSTHDGGDTWAATGVELPSSAGYSTADGYLVGDTLSITYSGSPQDVRFATVQYDSASKTWAIVGAEVVSAVADTIALTPAMAVDRMGRLWLAYTSQDTVTLDYSIKLMLKESAAAGWVDTGFVFGDIDNLSSERAARPIVTSRGIGMVFTVHEDMYWAERNDNWALDATWPRALIYTKVTPTNDPFGSHFSMVADDAYNMHMFSVDGGKVIYSRYLVSRKAWVSKSITTPMSATYLQALIAANGNVVCITNSLTNLRVLQSSNGGKSFVATHALTHPAPKNLEDYNRPRVEAPARPIGDIPVLQQYFDGSRQGALYFSVPVAPPAN